ncbi:proton-conducting transporter membrane subunit [Heliophilum fasciatum]|nr:proton-conducting transporter membrane subunit [Heliophilum fasciatum]
MWFLAIPAVTACLCLFVPSPAWKHRINALGGLLLPIAAMPLIAQVLREGPQVRWGGHLYVDALSALLLMIIVLVGFCAACFSLAYMERERQAGIIDTAKLGRYYLWMHLFLLTMLAAAMVNNLGLLWVAIEATTLVSALLVGFYGREASIEAAWKYILLCSVGIALALLGLILLYFAAMQSGLMTLNWSELLPAAGRFDPELVKLAFIFVVIGFGTKAGFAPMHNWMPDAYSQAPSPISALLSAVLINCALVGVFRFHVLVVRAVPGDFASHLLLGFGIFSMVIAVPFVLLQHDIKRLLAYSSVEHVGLIVAAVGIGSPLALFGATWHLFNHALTKAALFLIVGRLEQQYKTRKIARIRGALARTPWLGAALLAGILALAGAPPFGLFMSELTVVAAGLGAPKGWTGMALLAPLLLAFTGMVYHVGKMVLGMPSLKWQRSAAMVQATSGSPLEWIALLPLALVLMMGIMLPEVVREGLLQAAAVLGGAGR